MSNSLPPSAAKSRLFMQCDVFSTAPLGGNGLAVVLDGAGLDTDTMQRFARWTNLAETTFVCPPSDPAADYDIRIFTASYEMRFAGHPTLGTAACWLAAGNAPKQAGVIRQNCGVGLVEIDLTGPMPAFVAPPTTLSDMPTQDLTRIVDSLKLDRSRIVRTAVLDNGPVWHALELKDSQDVLGLDASNITAGAPFSVGLIAPHTSGCSDFEVRMFDLHPVVLEDPITGSLNAALAHWRQVQGRTWTQHIVAQGTCIGRTGRVHVLPTSDDPNNGPIRIGGHTNILIEGHVTL